MTKGVAQLLHCRKGVKRASGMAILVSLAIMTGALQGCASPATQQGMTVTPSMVERTNDTFKHAIRIDSVAGGKDTNPLWTSQVGTEDFKKALTDSLGNAGYLASSDDQAKYALSANFLELDQPLIGLTLDVKSSVQYQLKGNGLDKSIPVRATGTAGFSDAAIAIARLRIASERSILENIKELLRQLADIR
ncbi:MAG: hypothetical protein PHR30_05055 [Gallionellaceae bacterium]|nr:hypothetical protein [Gallionellaceae bacterium]